jgi:hypothetical protein
MTIEKIKPSSHKTESGRQYFKDLGRILDDKSQLINFEGKLLDIITRRNIEYRPRKTPGTVYAYGTELVEASKINGNPLEGVINTVEARQRLSGSRNKIIDRDLALNGLTVPVTGVRLSPITSRDPSLRRFNLLIGIGDYPCTAYSGFVIDGENRAIRGFLGIEVKEPNNTQAQPENYVMAGTLTFLNVVVRKEEFSVLREALGDELSIRRIGDMSATDSYPNINIHPNKAV